MEEKYTLSMEKFKNIIKALGRLQELVGKETPKEPILYTDVIHGEEENVYECPKCGSFLGYENECKEEYYQSLYCSGCGQRLDWSKKQDE